MAPDTSGDLVRIERIGPVLLMSVNRPAARNALDASTADALASAFDTLDHDDDLRVGVLTGQGDGFSAGLDLKAFLDSGLPANLLEVFERGAEKPLIAAVEEFALAGGLELALTCDLIIAGEGARFGIPEVGVGLFAGGGALFRLQSRVGVAHTMELALTGQPIGAARGADIGLVNRVVPAGTAVDAALELAQRIAANAPLAVRASKRVIWSSIGCTDEEAWRNQEGPLAEVLGSADAVEGPRAFAEKRSPEWAGR